MTTSKRAAGYTVDGQRHSVSPGATRFQCVCTTVDVSFPGESEKGRTIRPFSLSPGKLTSTVVHTVWNRVAPGLTLWRWPSTV